GRLPTTLHATDRTVDVEHLEHGLQTRAVELDVRLERLGAERSPGLLQGGQRALDQLFAREGERGEVGPDVAVLDAREQDDRRGAGDAATRAADLLVVRHR